MVVSAAFKDRECNKIANELRLPVASKKSVS
jgi:hypothetical protein